MRRDIYYLRQIAGLLSEAQGSHSPFKNTKTLGPGPEGETRVRKNKWKCHGTAPYTQVCYGVSGDALGKVLVMRLDPAKKKARDRKYRRMKRGSK